MVVSVDIEVLKADMKFNKEISAIHTQRSMERFEQNPRGLWSLSECMNY